jgi:hypothetical protein
MSKQDSISNIPAAKAKVQIFFSIVFSWIKCLWPLLLPLILLLPGIIGFPYPSNDATFSDISIAHYPYTLYLRNALLTEGRIPLWSSLILSGHPFAANPLSGLWYPPGWLAMILPLPFGFNLLVLLHLLWGGIGLYLLLVSEGLEHRPALFGAIAFVTMPKLFSHFGAGHLTLLYAIPWTPWLLWAGSEVRKNRVKRIPWLEGAILALIFFADVRWSIFAGVLWVAYRFAHSHKRGEEKLHLKALSPVAALVGQASLAGLLIAPLALSLAQFVFYTNRSQMTAGEVFSYSLPFVRLLGYLFPDFGGFHEWMLYVSAAVLLLTLILLTTGGSNKGYKFWIWTAGVSLLFSFGSQIPLLPYLARLPLLSLLRVPSRALFITSLSMSVLAAYGLQGLLNGFSSTMQRRSALMLTGVLGFVLTLTFGVWFLTGEVARNFLWGAVFFSLVVILILASSRGWLRQDYWFIGLLVISLVDLWGVNRSLFSYHKTDAVLSENKDMARWLASRGGQFRIYSPSYSIPQQTAAFYRLQLADGVDPLQLQTYVNYMEQATGVPADGYSVTMPPFETGAPDLDNVSYLPDPKLLGLLNVKYVASQFDISVSNLNLVEQFGNTRLYENDLVHPRAWIQESELTNKENIKPAKVEAWNSDRIVVQTEDTGLLVISELIYPGWQVRVNGQAEKLQTANGLLRAVNLDNPGFKEVVFVFRPLSVYLGCLISSLTLIILIVFSVIRCKTRSKTND